jgi:beta-glucosidase
MLARFEGTAGRWRINHGGYHVLVGKGANDLHVSADTKLAEALFGT